jgi:hypothetical protein
MVLAAKGRGCEVRDGCANAGGVHGRASKRPDGVRRIRVRDACWHQQQQQTTAQRPPGTRGGEQCAARCGRPLEPGGRGGSWRIGRSAERRRRGQGVLLGALLGKMRRVGRETLVLARRCATELAPGQAARHAHARSCPLPCPSGGDTRPFLPYTTTPTPLHLPYLPPATSPSPSPPPLPKPAAALLLCRCRCALLPCPLASSSPVSLRNPPSRFRPHAPAHGLCLSSPTSLCPHYCLRSACRDHHLHRSPRTTRAHCCRAPAASATTAPSPCLLDLAPVAVAAATAAAAFVCAPPLPLPRRIYAPPLHRPTRPVPVPTRRVLLDPALALINERATPPSLHQGRSSP